MANDFEKAYEQYKLEKKAKKDKPFSEDKKEKKSIPNSYDNLITHSPFKWAKYSKIIILAEEEPKALFLNNLCTQEEAETLALTNLFCLVLQNNLNKNDFASILFSLDKTNVAYNAIYKNMYYDNFEKAKIAKEFADIYHSREIVGDGECDKDFSNTKAYTTLKKISLLGMLSTLFIIWVIFWNGDYGLFDPRHSLFSGFLHDVANMHWSKARAFSKFTAFAVLPLSWVLRDVTGFFLISLYYLVFKKL